MKIVTTMDGLALYFFNDENNIKIDKGLIVNGQKIAIDVKEITHKIIQTENLPPFLIGGIFSFVNNEWIISSQETFDNYLIEIKKQKKEANAAARYAKETSGVDYNGHLISTGREDWMIMDSTMDKIRRGIIEKVDEWKCKDDSYLVLNSSNIAEIEILVLTHIQGSFAKEKYYNDLIDQGVEVELIY